MIRSGVSRSTGLTDQFACDEGGVSHEIVGRDLVVPSGFCELCPDAAEARSVQTEASDRCPHTLRFRRSQFRARHYLKLHQLQGKPTVTQFERIIQDISVFSLELFIAAHANR